jgi:GNAT superfamily N-acetyltransferase
MDADKEMKTKRKAAPRIVAERSAPAAVARALWKGLIKFNNERAGPLDYSRKVISVRDARGRLAGGLILESYWRESYIELLWVSARLRGAGCGRRLIKVAERVAKKRGSVLIHLNTYSFQAPGFYEGLGYKPFGTMKGSPEGQCRYFYFRKLNSR